MPPGTRILIVEDEESLAENLWSYFRRRLAEVKVVSSGEAAIEVAGRFRPDLLILDYGLPGMNGLETFTRLKHLQPSRGCVMITADPIDTLRNAARASGIGHVVEKPFSFAQLECALACQDSGLADPVTAGRRLGERRLARATSVDLPAIDDRRRTAWCPA